MTPSVLTCMSISLLIRLATSPIILLSSNRWEGFSVSTSTQDQTITFLISCPDRPGIVAAVSQFIFQHHGNICQSDQHSTNRQASTFFMRISISQDGFPLSQSEIAEQFRPIAERFHMQWVLYY